MINCTKGNYLKQYTIFCNNQQTSFAAVENLKKNSNFVKFLEVMSMSHMKKNSQMKKRKTFPECRGLDLVDFLIKPVQVSAHFMHPCR